MADIENYECVPAIEALRLLIARRRVTDAALQSMLKRGFVLESDLLPIFAKHYSEEFREYLKITAADDLQAEVSE